MLVMLIFLAAGGTILGLGAAGIAYSAAPLKQSYSMMKCSLYLLIDETLYGSVQGFGGPADWQGVQNIIDNAKVSIASIQGESDKFSEVANKPLGSNSYSSSQAALDTIANKYDESKAAVYGVTNPANGNSGFILDVRKNFVKYTVSSSFSYPIYMQRTLFQTTIYNSMGDLIKAAKSAMDKKTFDDAISSLSSMNFGDKIKPYKKNLQDFLKNADNNIDNVTMGFTVYYAVCMGCVALMVLGSFAAWCGGCVKCRCLTHLGWVILGFLMIIGFLLGTILFPLSVILQDVCGILPLSSLAKIGSNLFSDQWDQLSTCLVGNGDLYTKYNLGNQLGFINSTSSALDLINSVYDATTQSLKNNVTDQYLVEVIFSAFIF